MNRFLKGFGIFLALVCIGVLSALAVIGLLLREDEVRVPDLAGQDIVNVIELVRQQGLELKVDRREPHPTLARDTLISQAPPAGSTIKKGRMLRVVVSQGPSDLLAPKIVGDNFRKADITIRQAGFLPGESARVASDTVERDAVIAQCPEAGSPLEKGGTIDMLVSAGKRTDRLIMPQLVGKRPEDALRLVDRMELQHRVIVRQGGGKPAAEARAVLAQKPAAGYPVAPDATVDIIVNK